LDKESAEHVQNSGNLQKAESEDASEKATDIREESPIIVC
jgi:phage-related minor tail protein